MRWISSLVFVLCASVALALPTQKDVEAAVKSGDYTQAQTMMQEVVDAKPGSAKAHYLYAEILAHNGRFEDATAQALKAKQLDPKISFTSPEKFRHFEALLLNSSQGGKTGAPAQSRIQSPQSTIVTAPAAQLPAPAPAEQRQSGGFGWGAILLIVVIVGALIMFARRRSQAAQVYQSAPVGGPQGGGYGNGGAYGPGPTVVNPGGSGIGTGIAAGVGGFAAGMLAEELLSRHGSGLGGDRVVENNTYITENYNGGGSGANADQQLENDPIDFGNGNDWDNSSDSGMDMGSNDDNNW